MCTCALFLEASSAVNSHYAFVDVCGASQEVNQQFRYFEKQKTPNALVSGDFPSLNCSAHVVANEIDETEWTAVPFSPFGIFKCARLRTSSSTCETFLVK
jgi:hypothetical protein